MFFSKTSSQTIYKIVKNKTKSPGCWGLCSRISLKF